MTPQKTIERNRTLSLVDFMKANVTCTSNKMGEGLSLNDVENFTLLGEWICPPQCRAAIGIRPDLLQPLVGGLFHFEPHDAGTATDVEGEAKLVIRSADGLKKRIIVKRRTDSMYKTSPADKSKQYLLKLGFNVPLIWAREDSVIQLLFKPDVFPKTINYDNVNNILILEITMQHLYEQTQAFI